MNQRRIEPCEERQYIIAYVQPIVCVRGKLYLSGYVMHCEGSLVDMHLEEYGAELEYWDWDNIPDPSAKGILVWEGVCQNARHYLAGADCEAEFVGKWRNPELTDLKLVIGNIGVRSDAPAAKPDPEQSIDPCTATTGNPLEDE